MKEKLTAMVERDHIDYIRQQAEKNHRNLSGQLTYMIEIAREVIDHREKESNIIPFSKGGGAKDE